MIANILDISEDLFFRDYFGRKFLYACGIPGRFAHLLPWEVLNDLLRHSQVGPPRVRLVKEGQALPDEFYVKYRDSRLSPPRPFLLAGPLTEQLRNGATLIFDAIDEVYDPIGSLVEDFGRLLGVSVRANMYASWRESPGFDLHWDDHEVIVLQVHGRKQWQIHGETERFPIDKQSDQYPPNTGPIWEGVLRDGDALYIPRGWWHAAVPCDEPTLHLTVGFVQPTGIDLLKWITDRLAASPFVRMDIPRMAGTEAISEYLASFRHIIADLCADPNLLQDFFRHRDGTAWPRYRFGLPWSAMSGILPDSECYLLNLALPRRLELTHRVQAAQVDLAFHGRVFTFHEATTSLFEYLVRSTPISISDFYTRFEAEFSHAQLTEFLTDLARYGLISLNSPGKLATVAAC